jgi:hypothetical protein
MDTQKILVLKSSQSPEMGEPLNGGFFIRRIMGIKRSFDSFSELEREVLAESHDEIDDLGMHMRVVQQRPQFLQSQLLIVSTNLIHLLLHYDQLKRVVERVLVLPHQALYHRLNGG